MKPIKRPIQIRPLVTRPQVCLGVIFRDNVDTIQKLLDSVVDHFDEYVFTDTGSVDGTRAIIDRFAKGRRVAVNDFEWCDDFSKARNYNKSAAKARWYMFLDTDDVLVDGGKVRDVLNTVEQRPDLSWVQGFFVPYDYDKDERLTTMRLCRNEPAWRFVDAIHERLTAEGSGTDYGDCFGNVRDFSVWHKRKSSAEKKAALYRNAAIAEREHVHTKDKAYRARLARTIAMIPKAEGRIEDAIPWLLETATDYPNHPEGRQAYADLARIHASQGALDEALSYAKQAGPSYEAIVLRAKDDFEGAIERQTRASVAGQQTTHEGFLFEQCVAPVIMAESAFQTGYEPRQVERVLNTVRGDLRAHEAVRDAVSFLRGSLDRITILVPNTPQPFDGNTVKRNEMLGGSEEAVVYLTRALAKLGRNVRVYGVLPPLTVPGTVIDGVEWHNFTEFNPHDEHGCLVIWRAAGLLLQLADMQVGLRTRRGQGDETAIPFTGVGHTSLWLHDMALGLPPNEAQIVPKCCDEFIVLSKFHQDVIQKSLPEGATPTYKVLSNGIVADQFREWSVPRDPNRVVFSSSPDRGLRVLLESWPAIKAACPEAYLDIYYDWSMLKRMQPEVHAALVAQVEALADQGVKYHGGVGHKQIHEALMGAGVWAYSHFDNPLVETSCISAMKSTAAGCAVVTVPNGALPETVPEAVFVEKPEDYAEAVIGELRNPEPFSVRRQRADRMLARFDWDVVAEQFSKVWTVRGGG